MLVERRRSGVRIVGVEVIEKKKKRTAGTSLNPAKDVPVNLAGVAAVKGIGMKRAFVEGVKERAAGKRRGQVMAQRGAFIAINLTPLREPPTPHPLGRGRVVSGGF